LKLTVIAPAATSSTIAPTTTQTHTRLQSGGAESDTGGVHSPGFGGSDTPAILGQCADTAVPAARERMMPAPAHYCERISPPERQLCVRLLVP
jgi:hypothetical protein